MTRALVLGCLLAALIPSNALAQKQRLAVVELAAPSNLAGIGAKLTQDILAAASGVPAYEVLEPGAVEKLLGNDGMSKLHACSGRPECAAPLLAPTAAARAVVGTLDRTETSYLVKLYLIDLKAKTVLSTVDRSILIASRRLNADVKAAIPGLLEGKAEARASVSITTKPAGATLFFDGANLGPTPKTVETKPGKHTVRVTKESYLPVERFVTVEEGNTEQVSLAMTAVPGTNPDDKIATSTDKEKDDGPGIYIPTSSYVFGGIAAVAFGSAAFFGGRSKDVQAKAVDSDGDGVKNVTRAQALVGQRDTVIANASFITAGLALGATVLFFALTPAPPPPDNKGILNSVLPRPEPREAAIVPLQGGAAVTLGGTF